MKRVSLILTLMWTILVLGCGTQDDRAATSPSETIELSLTPCDLPAVVAPTPPPEMPAELQLDPYTGLHMTGSPRQIDLETYRLKVTGKVDRPIALTYDQLRCLPRVSANATLVCPGAFVDTGFWAGTPIRHVLDLAGVHKDAVGVRLASSDGYAALLTMEDALSEANFLAYEWQGEPLPILHGFPIRAVLPEFDGGNWVKWLIKIEVY